MVDATPQKVLACTILYSVKMIMLELMCFSAFPYQYIESFAILRVARRGNYNPP